MSKVLQELEQLALARTKELKKAKKAGKKIIQYTGNFVSDELIRAAGAEPYLLCRGGDPEPTEVILDDMLRFLNPLARSMAGFYRLGTDPVTPICDLIVAHQSECHTSRITERMEAMGLPFFKLGIPQDWDREFAFQYYVDGLKELAEKLEEMTGNKLDKEALVKYMELTNKMNAGLRKIDELRKKANPPITSLEFIKLNHYSYMVEPTVFVEKLDELYEELKDAPGKYAEGAPRLLVFGHAVAIGDYTVIRTFEEAGAAIVAEFMDEGMRAFRWDFDLSDPDPIHAFAKTRYLEKVPVNIFQPSWKNRYAHIESLMADYNVDAVISYQLVFDEIYNMEGVTVEKKLTKKGVPFMKIESSYEYTREAMGQLITRSESFVESVKEVMAK